MSIADARDRLIAADPGLVRLHMALRATAAVGTALGVLLAIRSAVHFPLTVPLLGAALGMTWNISVNDRTLAQQKVTTLLLWPAAAACVTIGTLTSSNRILGDALFVITLFLSVYVRRYGPRGAAVGTVGVIAFFFALFLHASTHEIPWMLLALAVTAVGTYFYRFVVFRERPKLALVNALAAFRARVRLIRRSGSAHARNHHLYRLNEIALTLDDLLASPDDRRAVLQAELSAAGREHDQQSLGIHASAPTRADWTARGPFRAGTQPDTGRIAPTTRQAVQLTAAAIPAIVIGELVSPQRWYWAALAAFVVFLGTSSSGETRVKAWSRTLGTALGVLAGVLVAYPVRGHDKVAFCTLLVCLFACVYTVRLSYAVMIFFLTVLLSMLYVLLGLFSDQLLVIRLVETAVGTLLGGIAATVILPISTSVVLQNVSIEALRRLKDFVDAAVRRLTGDESADALGTVRALDEALQSVRAQIEPLTSSKHVAGVPDLTALLNVFMSCGNDARALAVVAYGRSSDSPLDELYERGGRIDRDIDALVSGDAPVSGAPPAPEGPAKAALYLYRIDTAVRELARELPAAVQRS